MGMTTMIGEELTIIAEVEVGEVEEDEMFAVVVVEETPVVDLVGMEIAIIIDPVLAVAVTVYREIADLEMNTMENSCPSRMEVEEDKDAEGRVVEGVEVL